MTVALPLTACGTTGNYVAFAIAQEGAHFPKGYLWSATVYKGSEAATS